MFMLLSCLRALIFHGTNGFHLGGDGLHHDSEPFERVLPRRIKGDQFKMICRRFCGLQDKDISIVFLGVTNLILSIMLKEGPFIGGTGYKING